MLKSETPKLIDIEFQKPNLRIYIFTVKRKTLRLHVRRQSHTKYLVEHIDKHAWRVLDDEQTTHIYKLVHGQENWKPFDRKER